MQVRRLLNIFLRYIIHAVGPSGGYPSASEKDELKTAVYRVIQIAEEKKLESIAIPAVSSGIFGFPKVECANIMIGIIIT